MNRMWAEYVFGFSASNVNHQASPLNGNLRLKMHEKKKNEIKSILLCHQNDYLAIKQTSISHLHANWEERMGRRKKKAECWATVLCVFLLFVMC